MHSYKGKYNSINRAVIILLTAFTGLFFNCKANKKVPYNELYWKFHHTIENVDIITEKIEFNISERRVKVEEVDTLANILKQWGWEYYISFDSTLFVRKYGDDIIGSMRSLDDELYKRMKDTTNRTFYR